MTESATSTAIELKEGTLVYLPSGEHSDRRDPELFALARELDYGSVYIWGLKPIPHFNRKGWLCDAEEGDEVWNEEWVDNEEGRVDFRKEVLDRCLPLDVPSLGLAKLVTEGSESWYDNGSSKVPVFHMNTEGLPLCGSKASRDQTKEAGRWNPWLKLECPERREQSVWLPSMHEPTCKKCAKKG